MYNKYTSPWTAGRIVRCASHVVLIAQSDEVILSWNIHPWGHIKLKYSPFGPYEVETFAIEVISGWTTRNHITGQRLTRCWWWFGCTCTTNVTHVGREFDEMKSNEPGRQRLDQQTIWKQAIQGKLHSAIFRASQTETFNNSGIPEGGT